MVIGFNESEIINFDPSKLRLILRGKVNLGKSPSK